MFFVSREFSRFVNFAFLLHFVIVLIIFVVVLMIFLYIYYYYFVFDAFLIIHFFIKNKSVLYLTSNGRILLGGRWMDGTFIQQQETENKLFEKYFACYNAEEH